MEQPTLPPSDARSWTVPEQWGGTRRKGQMVEEWQNDRTWEFSRSRGLQHRSTQEFSPGDVLMTPAERGRSTNFYVSSDQHVYATELRDSTIWEEDIHGEETLSHTPRANDPGEWLGSRSYEVKPLGGALSADPNMDGVRSRVGFEVLKETTMDPADRTYTAGVAPLMRGYFRTMMDR